MKFSFLFIEAKQWRKAKLWQKAKYPAIFQKSTIPGISDQHVVLCWLCTVRTVQMADMQSWQRDPGLGRMKTPKKIMMHRSTKGNARAI